nr:hypothetical protein [Tanacetum cinerariifolium]
MATLQFADAHNMVAFLSKPIESDGFEQIFWSTAMAKTINGEAQLHATVDGKKIIVTGSSVRRDLRLADEKNEAIHKELGDRLVRATTASSLEAEHDSGGGPRCQETMRDTIAQTRVESSGDEESLGDNASKQGRRINSIDADEDITLVSAANNEMFDVDVLGGDEVFVVGQNKNVVEEVVDVAQVSTAATTVTITTEEITLAQAIEALKTLKPKVKGIVFQEPCKSTTTTTISSQQSQDKGKGIMIEEPVTPKKKDQIRLDEEAAKKLQAQEQEELSDAEKATLFQQLLDKRRKHFAAKRAQEKRNKPSTKSKQRKVMCTYLKNMKGYKLKDLKLKEFDSIQEMFDKTFKRQKVEDDKERAELKQLMKTIPDKEEVAIDAISLASSKIVDWRINKEGKKSYYQIVRDDGKSQMYMIFSPLLKSFDREDLEDLYKLSTFLDDAVYADLHVGREEAIHKELGDRLVRATAASSVEAEHDSGGGPRCQETMRDTIAQTRFERVSKQSNNSLLVRGNTLRNDEDSLKLDELMALCTTLQNKVLDLEKTTTTQRNEIASLKRSQEA